MKTILKLVYLGLIVTQVYWFYSTALVPVIPVVSNALSNGISLEVAFDSVSVNGMTFTSLSQMLTRTSIYFILLSLGIAVTTFVYNLLNKILP